jgi:hypothetical protein
MAKKEAIKVETEAVSETAAEVDVEEVEEMMDDFESLD